MSRILSPINLLAMKPVWCSLIKVGRTTFKQLAIHADPILYTKFRSEIGLQFCNNCLSLFPFGIHIITTSFCVDNNSPFLNPSFNELTMKAPNCNQKNYKKTTAVKPSDSGLLLFFIFLSAALASSKVIFPEVFSCNSPNVILCG